MMIAEHGEDWVLASVVTRMAEGEAPADIARSMGMPWFVMRRWMEDSDDRMKDMELAKRCFADGLIWDGLAAARDADIETLGVSKLKADHYTKVAEKMSRREWGNEKETGAGGITVVVQRGLTAEVTQGGVLTILPDKREGYPVPEAPAINVEVV